MNHVLVDTSVWIDHLRSSNPVLEAMLTQGEALMHPLVLGELSMGSLANRAAFLKSAATVPDATLVMDHRVRDIVETHFGSG
jgi:predicted nucleic acid-binding protein